jgi:hypothetical protein
MSYLLQIVPELYTIPLLGFFNLSKNDILKTVHGTCFTSTLVARIPKNTEVVRLNLFIYNLNWHKNN